MTLQSNQKTKKIFKERAIGKDILTYAFEPGPWPERKVGKGIAVEGPYPVHRWYAVVDTDVDGVVVKVI